MNSSKNDVHDIIHNIKHYLPSQTPIKDFIHHNSLHAYQHMKFYDAIFKAGKIFGYNVSLRLDDFRKLYETGRIKSESIDQAIKDRHGDLNVKAWRSKMIEEKYDTHVEPRIGNLRENWKKVYGIDLDNKVQPLLFRILSSYLDQGISIQKFPVQKEGFLATIISLERNSGVSFFKTRKAKELLLLNDLNIEKVLEILVGDKSYYEQYLFDQTFTHQGWSGIVSAVEDSPHTLLDPRKISLEELIIVESILEIDALESHNKNWKSISKITNCTPIDLFLEVEKTELQEIIILWQNAFEWSYYDDVLTGFVKTKDTLVNKSKKSFQAIFCIDERECSLRRHVESVDKECETLGCPGFFGAEFYFQPHEGKFYEKLCPAPVTPKYLVKESDVPKSRPNDVIYAQDVNTFLKGTFNVFIFGLWSLVRLWQNLFSPKMSPAISNAYAHMQKGGKLSVENSSTEHRENDLQIGYTIEEMAIRVEGLLKGIGLVDNFSPIIYPIGHGTTTANNPHHSAHDCGACSGRPGSANARVFAHMANHKKVREILSSKGINIPDSTQFIGGMHDTSADMIELYDEDILSSENKKLNEKNLIVFEKSLDLNSKERSRRFASIKTNQEISKVRQAILDRSVSLFEPRPELGHGTNSVCVVGRRKLTKNIFLDRRSFLNSYDPTIDPDGSILSAVIRPIGLVCGGINLEYYFSRVDNYKLGAGTKLPHNVVGLIGVANSTDGDLRPGLPLQMIEVHDPVRLLVIVEHHPDIVHKAIQQTPEIYEWYINEWVHIVAIDPITFEMYYFKDGKFDLYHPKSGKVDKLNDVIKLIDASKEMKTNYIVHATKENLPIYVLED